MSLRTLFFALTLIVTFGLVWHYPKLDENHSRSKCAENVVKMQTARLLDEERSRDIKFGIDPHAIERGLDNKQYRICLALSGVKPEILLTK